LSKENKEKLTIGIFELYKVRTKIEELSRFSEESGK